MHHAVLRPALVAQCARRPRPLTALRIVSLRCCPASSRVRGAVRQTRRARSRNAMLNVRMCVCVYVCIVVQYNINVVINVVVAESAVFKWRSASRCVSPSHNHHHNRTETQNRQSNFKSIAHSVGSINPLTATGLMCNAK